MKIIEFANKPYSWLQWPVTLNGCPKTTLHITAKFFGAVKIDRNAIIGRLPLQEVMWHTREFLWYPTIFSGGHVLELIRFPKEMLEFHNRFDLVMDQFTPWRPHISVSRDYWIKVDSEGLTPESENMTLGEIELCLGMALNKTATDEGQGDKNANHN